MGFAVSGLKGLIFLVALMPAVSFADIAAPPPSSMTVYLTDNGINVTSIPQITYICTYSGNAGTESDIALDCSDGVCTNEQETGSVCTYFPYGYFSYEYLGQNKSSEVLNNRAAFYEYYQYQLDVQTGKLTLISAYNNPGPSPAPCAAAFLLGALLLVAARRG
jgi:hypothetical protein